MTDDKSLYLEVLAELQDEISALQTVPEDERGNVEQMVKSIGPCPREALFLGLASDGLPVLLNLHDSLPGPILIAGDPGAGKTSFLKVVAKAGSIMHEKSFLEFGVITSKPNEWDDMVNMPNNVGVFPFYHRSSEDFILSLASWAHGKMNQQSVLLFIDDLEAANNLDFDARQNLRWLLLRGPARQVWPIVTLNPANLSSVETWMESFNVRIMGRIADQKVARAIEPLANDVTGLLKPGEEFVMREHKKLLRFIIPSL